MYAMKVCQNKMNHLASKKERKRNHFVMNPFTMIHKLSA
jgi:hypothetical protein